MLKEQIRYYKKYIKQYLSDFIDEEKTLKEELLQHFPSYITLIVNYTTSVKETQRAMIVICGAKNKHNQLYGTNYALSIQLSIYKYQRNIYSKIRRIL